MYSFPESAVLAADARLAFEWFDYTANGLAKCQVRLSSVWIYFCDRAFLAVLLH